MTATLTESALVDPVDDDRPRSPLDRRPIALGVLLVVGGLVGLIAAFNLTLDKFTALEHPGARSNCYLSVIVQCDKNLASPEGAVFGFPNPVIGLIAFPLVVLMGAGLLAGLRFPRWWMGLFNLGMAFGIGFVAFLITVSVFRLGTLCPWCMAVWIAVIPMSLATTLYDLREGVLPAPAALRRAAGAALGWTPLMSILCCLVVAVVAQSRLDVLATL